MKEKKGCPSGQELRLMKADSSGLNRNINVKLNEKENQRVSSHTSRTLNLQQLKEHKASFISIVTRQARWLDIRGTLVS